MSISWSGFEKGANYIENEGVYDSNSNSQTGTLNVKSGAVTQDKTYTCTVTSKTYPESASKTIDVLLNVFGEYIRV
jgi:hypothetical protein